jgi:hypothetical protein
MGENFSHSFSLPLFLILYFLHLAANNFNCILLYLMVMPFIMKGNRQELKPIMQPHSSHVITLSQACPNNISGCTLTYVIANLNYCFEFHFCGHI